MIPKIIHYIWFGDKPYPSKVQHCIDSWHKILPDYTFIKWGESNFDVNSTAFTRQAFENKMWAFVSDYVRIKALYEFGGWYLDTDVEVLKPLSPFENQNIVFGTDENGSLTAVYGTEPNNKIWKNILERYNHTPFLLGDNKLNTTVVNIYIEEELMKYGYVRENKLQNLGEGIIVYPDDYFHVKSLEKGTTHFTDNSTCVHWQTMLWTSRSARVRRWFRLKILKPLFGEDKFLEVYEKIVKKIR